MIYDDYDSAKNCFEQEDLDTTSFIGQYCGKIDYNLKMKKNETLIITLPENKNIGYFPLYCEFMLNNKDRITSLVIETTKNWGNINMKIKYMNSGEDIFILGNGEKNIINEPKLIKITFHSTEVKDNLPFSIKITNISTSIKITIISIILFCGFLGIIIIIIVVIICRKRMEKRNNRITILSAYMVTNSTQGSSTERDGPMNYLNQIIPKKYINIKDKTKNTKCPIDIEYFNDKSDVYFTKCSHTFHCNCLKDYICSNNNLKELKCPLCNSVLYSCDTNGNENPI
jgi:hypothetical protein